MAGVGQVDAKAVGGGDIQRLVDKAQVLVEALPYIRAFYGKTVVIKYGGHAMTNEDLKRAVATDIVLMRYVGMKPVLVHGGGPEISAMMKKVGKEAQFVDGLRVTDRETVEIAEMVLVGKINKAIVSLLNAHGGRAVGLSGKDGALIQTRKHLHRKNGSTTGELVDLGYVGDVEKIDPDIINAMVEAGYIPVVAPIGTDAGGVSYNINADYVAGELAAALRAHKLVLLTDVEGIFSSEAGRRHLISTLTAREAQGLIHAGEISGGMIPKVEACITALRGGVPRTHIIDGRIPHSLLLEVFTDCGVGTMVTNDEEE